MRFRALVLLVAIPLVALAEIPSGPIPLRFEVRLSPELAKSAPTGRVLVVLGPAGGRDPRRSIGDTGMEAPPVLGADAQAPAADGLIATLGPAHEIFPIESLAKLKPGKYVAQAMLHTNRDLNFPNAPGDLVGPGVAVEIDPAKNGLVQLLVNAKLPDESLPADTASVKYLKLPSKLLSDFHGRPMFLRAAVTLPADFDENPQAKYPLRVHIGGYGSRFTSAGRMVARRPKTGPQFLTLMLDGAGPFGDPYQVNSVNNGPYGDAVTTELIPHVEAKYRGVGAGHARFTDGHSTGGWVSLALQVFYPDFFNGCWSFCPDPVDFRAFELINIYEDKNSYLNRHGFERPSKRQVNGDTVYHVRHECQIENVLGLGNRWTLSGKDWGAWNATFGPKGPDGLPKPLWDAKSGAIDRSVVDHWKQYDLRRVLENDWASRGPKLRGKMHIYAGDCDDYFLNNAVRLMDKFLKSATPSAEAEVVIGPYASHSFHPLSDAETLAAMHARFKAAAK